MTAAKSNDSERLAQRSADATATDRVSIIGHTRPDCPFAFQNGATITAAEFISDVTHLRDRLPEARYVINLASDRYHFALGLGAALLREHITLLPSNHTIATIDALIDAYPKIYAITDGLRPHPGLQYIDVARSATDDATFRVPTVAHNTDALVLFTSGSTGAPVPTQKQWGPFLHSVRSEAEGLGLQKFRGLSVLGTVPAQHSYGLESTILLPMLTGSIMDAGKPFYPADICSALATMPRPRMLVTTPVHLRALMRSHLLCPPVDIVLSATAPLPLDLARETEERFRAPVMEIYGCSEAGQIATRHTLGSGAWTLMRDIVLTQEHGDTFASGGHVHGEVKLADVIEVLDDRQFLLHGRGADVINIAGKRTLLAHLNHQLNTIDGVEDGTFFMPDESDDEVTRLVALVVAPTLQSTDILKALRDRIDAVFLPRPLWQVERLPRNAAGKLPREDLSAQIQRLRQKHTR